MVPCSCFLVGRLSQRLNCSIGRKNTAQHRTANATSGQVWLLQHPAASLLLTGAQHTPHAHAAGCVTTRQRQVCFGTHHSTPQRSTLRKVLCLHQATTRTSAGESALLSMMTQLSDVGATASTPLGAMALASLNRSSEKVCQCLTASVGAWVRIAGAGARGRQGSAQIAGQGRCLTASVLM